MKTCRSIWPLRGSSTKAFRSRRYRYLSVYPPPFPFFCGFEVRAYLGVLNGSLKVTSPGVFPDPWPSSSSSLGSCHSLCGVWVVAVPASFLFRISHATCYCSLQCPTQRVPRILFRLTKSSSSPCSCLCFLHD